LSIKYLKVQQKTLFRNYNKRLVFDNSALLPDWLSCTREEMEGPSGSLSEAQICYYYGKNISLASFSL